MMVFFGSVPAINSQITRYGLIGASFELSSGFHCAIHSSRMAVISATTSLGSLFALMVCFSSPISARQALDWGLINAVAPAAELDDAVLALLTRATRGSRESKGIGKSTLYAQLDVGQADAYRLAIEVMAATSQTDDAREGIAAFLEKRQPSWPQ